MQHGLVPELAYNDIEVPKNEIRACGTVGWAAIGGLRHVGMKRRSNHRRDDGELEEGNGELHGEPEPSRSRTGQRKKGFRL